MFEIAKTETENVIEKLRDYPGATFYLTGSRYYGREHDFSDWDYFVQDTEETRKYLHTLGFRLVKKQYTYVDYDCVGVMRYKNVDVQFSSNVKIRLAMRLLMLDYGKDFTRAEWQNAYQLAKSLVKILCEC